MEDVKDDSGTVVQDAPLEFWSNVKQRALDHALKEINKQSDIQLEIEFVGRGALNSARDSHPNAGNPARRQTQRLVSDEAGKDIFEPYPADQMTVWPINPPVNSPKNDNLNLLEPIVADVQARPNKQ